MRCPKFKAGIPHPSHWHTVRTDGITFAGGRCPGFPAQQRITLVALALA